MILPSPMPKKCQFFTSFWVSWLNKYSGTIDEAIGITWPKCHVESPFHHLHLTNGMVPYLTLSTLCDTDTSINGTTWPKTVILHNVTMFLPNEYHGACGNAIDVTWCWCQCQVSNDWKSHTASHFDYLELTNAMVLLVMSSVSCGTNTGITWP